MQLDCTIVKERGCGFNVGKGYPKSIIFVMLGLGQAVWPNSFFERKNLTLSGKNRIIKGLLGFSLLRSGPHLFF